MVSDDFDALVNQANLLAGSGNWQVAYGKLVQAEGLQPENPGLLNGIGTCLLQLDRPAEAVNYFKKVKTLLPESPDALHSLGLAYAALGIFPLAEAAYRDALTIDPDFRMAIRSLAVVCIKQEERIKEGLEMLIALLKDNPEDIETLLILASSYEEGEQYTSAKDLCQYVLSIEPENENALETLERLSAFKDGISQSAELVIPGGPGDLRIDESKPVSGGWLGGRSIIFYAGFEFSNAMRLMIPAQVLQRGGMNVKYASEIDPQEIQQFDTFVFSRPHLKQEWVDAFQACMRAGKRIILDIDEDFHNLPSSHPGFDVVGQGHPMALEIFEKMLQAAELVTVSSSILADRYKSFTRRIEIVPTAWSNENQNWERPAQKHRTFNIGWIDLPSERDNLTLIKNDVSRFIKENPRALLVIGGDIGAVKIFDDLEEDRVLYLPFSSFEDYPYVLSQFDVLLSPVKRTPYNYARSDVRLMEAGVRRIPWLASKIPSYQEWEVGGVFVENNKDWYKILNQLHKDPELRQKLGAEGRSKAETRESAEIAGIWKSLFE